LKRILALDTSTWWGSVALVERTTGTSTPRVVIELGQRVDDSHAEHVVDWIARAFAEADWPRSSVDAYAATRGPGSFTGIRVALGTVRGLGLATGRPCIGVTTLEAIAEAHGPSGRDRFPVMDAGRAELYAAHYDERSSPPLEKTAPWLAAAADVLASAASNEAEIIVGPGSLIEAPNGAAAFTRAPERLAGAAGRIAALRAGPPASHEPLSPLYVRPPDALLKRSRS
jgi:tRNA threonylcarbamoyladenosine biosynthesis protein TsaB